MNRRSTERAYVAAVVKAWSEYAAAHPEHADVLVPLELAAELAVNAVFAEQSRLARVQLWGADLR